jgi:tetrahydromethanopterin S-methyltransferase subunit G
MALRDHLDESHPLKSIIKTVDELDKLNKQKLLAHLSQLTGKQISRKISILPKVNIITQIVAEYDRIYRDHETTKEDITSTVQALVDVSSLTPNEKEIIEQCQNIRSCRVESIHTAALELAKKLNLNSSEMDEISVSQSPEEITHDTQSVVSSHQSTESAKSASQKSQKSQANPKHSPRNQEEIITPINVPAETFVPIDLDVSGYKYEREYTVEALEPTENRTVNTPQIEEETTQRLAEEPIAIDHKTVKEASKIMSVRKRLEELLRPCRIARRRTPRAFAIEYSIEHLV